MSNTQAGNKLPKEKNNSIMKVEQIREGNKLIAEFENLPIIQVWSVNEKKRIPHWNIPKDKLSTMGFEWYQVGKDEACLKYHISWDWLHTAFEKFRSLKISLADEGFNDHYSRHLETIGVAIIHYPIEKAFERLVNGITWYNTNSKPGEAGIV